MTDSEDIADLLENFHYDESRTEEVLELYQKYWTSIRQQTSLREKGNK